MDPGLGEAGGRDKAAEAAAHDQDFNILGERVAGEFGVGIGVFEVVRVAAGGGDILGGTVPTQAAVALDTVFLTQGARIEVQRIRPDCER